MVNDTVIKNKGWELKIGWADHSCSWMPIVDIKEAVPVKVAEYANANKIDTKPAFAWWFHIP